MSEKMRFIPLEFEVLDNQNLTNTDKILYAYILALSQNEKGCCFMKSDQLAELVGIKRRQLVYCLNRLEHFNYISRSVIKKRRYIKPTINEFIDRRDRENSNKKPLKEIFDYDWLNDEEE